MFCTMMEAYQACLTDCSGRAIKLKDTINPGTTYSTWIDSILKPLHTTYRYEEVLIIHAVKNSTLCKMLFSGVYTVHPTGGCVV
jgi:hypothetical protein